MQIICTRPCPEHMAELGLVRKTWPPAHPYKSYCLPKRGEINCEIFLSPKISNLTVTLPRIRVSCSLGVWYWKQVGMWSGWKRSPAVVSWEHLEIIAWVFHQVHFGVGGETTRFRYSRKTTLRQQQIKMWAGLKEQRFFLTGLKDINYTLAVLPRSFFPLPRSSFCQSQWQRNSKDKSWSKTY